MTGSRKLAGTRIVIAALAVNALTTVLLLRAPLYGSSASTATSDGRLTARTDSATLFDVNGWNAIVPLLIPVLIAGLPLLAPSRRPAVLGRSMSAFILLAFVVLGAMTVGLFYLPSALLMTIAAFMAVRPPVTASDEA